ELAVSGLESAIRESGATVTHGPMPTVLASPAHLVLLFQNLLDNAIKFRKEAPPRVEARAEHRESEWLFSIQDNGIGIDPRHAEKIFTIFQRLHERGKYAGNGMGLAICKRILENHGGRIWVESSPGEGSTFFFTLASAEHDTKSS